MCTNVEARRSIFDQDEAGTSLTPLDNRYGEHLIQLALCFVFIGTAFPLGHAVGKAKLSPSRVCPGFVRQERQAA
jgi:hypothetical protein